MQKKRTGAGISRASGSFASSSLPKSLLLFFKSMEDRLTSDMLFENATILELEEWLLNSDLKRPWELGELPEGVGELELEFRGDKIAKGEEEFVLPVPARFRPVEGDIKGSGMVAPNEPARRRLSELSSLSERRALREFLKSRAGTLGDSPSLSLSDDWLVFSGLAWKCMLGAEPLRILGELFALPRFIKYNLIGNPFSTRSLISSVNTYL